MPNVLLLINRERKLRLLPFLTCVHSQICYRCDKDEIAKSIERNARCWLIFTIAPGNLSLLELISHIIKLDRVARLAGASEHETSVRKAERLNLFILVRLDCFYDLLRPDVPNVQLARLVACHENKAVWMEFHCVYFIIF